MGRVSPWSKQSEGTLSRNPLARFFATRPPRAEELARGCIFMLPGIESGPWQFNGAIRGMRDTGIAQAVRVIAWGIRPFGSLPNLMIYSWNKQRAQRIAQEITRYKESHPGRPVTLIGYSGGGGLAVLTAEALPAHVQIDRIVLMGAALSPGYSLIDACERCRGPVINFYSERDRVILGAGTRLLGTIDRRFVHSGGRIGFKTADCPPNLIQIPWTTEWTEHGHNGGHFGWLSRAWARHILAPQLVSSCHDSVQD